MRAVQARHRSFGQDGRLSPVDRLGIWLSARQVRRWTGPLGDATVCDAGCGYHATLARSLAGEARSVVAIDVALADEVKRHPGMRAVEGHLPEAFAALEDASMDVITCVNVLEHLWEPDRALAEAHRVLAPGGTLIVNVPSWRGKRFLELSAFRLGLSPAEEMDDHKRYYDPRDLWPMLVAAGFAPSRIRCFRHKAGLNTFAVCRAAATDLGR